MIYFNYCLIKIFAIILWTYLPREKRQNFCYANLHQNRKKLTENFQKAQSLVKIFGPGF